MRKPWDYQGRCSRAREDSDLGPRTSGFVASAMLRAIPLVMAVFCAMPGISSLFDGLLRAAKLRLGPRPRGLKDADVAPHRPRQENPEARNVQQQRGDIREIKNERDQDR